LEDGTTTMTKIHRFIGEWQLALGNIRLDDKELAHQMRSVLKLSPGEHIILGDGLGQEAHCTILSYDRNAVVVACVSIGRNASEPQAQVILYSAVLKGDHFEEAAGMATQVGIRELVPVVANRTVKRKLRTERLRRIVREAAELAGRGMVPTIREPLSLDEAFMEASRNDTNVFLDPSGKRLTGLGAGNRRVGVFIGPEGGWEESEITRAQEYGMRLIGLGPLILRAETATVIAVYTALDALRR